MDFHSLMWEKHKKLVGDYTRLFVQTKTKTDGDVLREEYRFIRDDEEGEDGEETWEKRLAKKYYEKLNREYAIGDLSRARDGHIGLRWRTQSEVVSGRGHFSCGAKGCSQMSPLTSYEVDFAYAEAGVERRALVKLRLCPSCSKLLFEARSHHGRTKEKEKDDRSHRHGNHRDHRRHRKEGAEEGKSSPPEKRVKQEPEKADAAPTMVAKATGDERETKPAVHRSREEEIDELFAGLFP